MIDLDAITAAVLAPDPYAALDALVRAALAAGRTVAQVLDAVRPHADAVLAAPGLTPDGEEAFLGTLDALTGDCHHSQHYRDPDPT